MKGIWPIVAEFHYKDKKLDYVCSIRLRKFSFDIWTCSGEHNHIKRSLTDDVIKNPTCPSCNALLVREKMWMCCAYILKSEDYINVGALLNRFTLLTWRIQHNKFRQSNILAYAKTFGNMIYELNYVNTFIDDEKNPWKDKGFEVSMKLFPITEQDVDKSYKRYEDNKLLRMI